MFTGEKVLGYLTLAVQESHYSYNLVTPNAFFFLMTV